MKFKKLIKTYFYAATTWFAALMMYTFMVAYFNNYNICIDVNLYGEALTEFVIIVLWVITGVYLLITRGKNV